MKENGRINLPECRKWQHYFRRGIQAAGQELEGRGCATEDRTDRIKEQKGNNCSAQSTTLADTMKPYKMSQVTKASKTN